MTRSPNPARMATAPDLAVFEGYVHFAFATIPDELRRYVHDVAIKIEDLPSDDILERRGLGSPFSLLGLYVGVPLPRRSVGGVRQDVDAIYLFRRPILEFWYRREDDLFAIIRHVLIHEIGHHFGFSDADMERLQAES